jgi:hypothetical protein
LRDRNVHRRQAARADDIPVKLHIFARTRLITLDPNRVA